MEIKCTTQAELDAAIAAGNLPVLAGGNWFDVTKAAKVIIKGARESLQPHVEAWGSSRPHVEAWGSSRPHVMAMESSRPHVMAMESSRPHVEAWGSSQPHVEAWGSSQPHVVAWESSQPHVMAMESSQPHVMAWGSSQPHVEARGSSQPHVEARGSSQPHVVARGSSQPHVEAWESSQPHVVAMGSSQPHVVAWESSQPHVVAMESSQPHVEAKGYALLSVRGGALVTAGPRATVLIHGARPKVSGGQQTRINISTPELWCAYYELSVKDGVVILYKGVGDDWHSPRGGDYTPATTPRAPDWDGGRAECGGGYHFSPFPAATLEFAPDAKHFVACPVALSEMVVHPDGDFPQKVKAAGCCGPVWECDQKGNRINP